MKFSCDKSEFLAAILTASRATAAKSPVPALEGLLLEAEDDAVSITGYNLKTGIVTRIEAEVRETGAFVLGAKLLGEIVRRAPEDTISLYTSADGRTRVDSGASTFDIVGTSAEDYPELPEIDGAEYIELGSKALKAMISQTSFAVSTDESRPILMGELFEVDKRRISVVAADGYRFALRREELDVAAENACAFIVPGSALSEVEKIITGLDEDVRITVGARYIAFTVASTVLLTRRLEGAFLNYKAAVPTETKFTVRADRRELTDAVERVSLIISDRVRSPLRCVFDDGLLKLRTVSAYGSASDERRVDGDGEGLEVGFNHKYLLDALHAAPADEIALDLLAATKPCIVRPVDADDESFLYGVLPVQLTRDAR
ncbi:MAG: DNA polymerase III subunit beta [Oscillospiraceae bacterium]|jgi:DNA polymerase-3 subunit beta|nr:DNA polymerase III subunit beta [Oscillospiraceae bacterium]